MGWAGINSGTAATPAVQIQAGKGRSAGAALPRLLLPYMAGRGKKYQKSLAMPGISYC